jgi:hypothetical protein
MSVSLSDLLQGTQYHSKKLLIIPTVQEAKNSCGEIVQSFTLF